MFNTFPKTQQKSFAAPKGRVETLTSFKHVKTEAVSRLTEDSRKDVSNLAFTGNPFKLTSDIEKKSRVIVVGGRKERAKKKGGALPKVKQDDIVCLRSTTMG